MTDDRRTRRTWNASRPIALALIAFAVLFTGLGVWSTNAQITGAVLGSGVIAQSSSITAVQHPVGGVVETIFVRDGDRVEAGDVLVRLEGREVRSDLKAAEGELFEALANIARLEAAIEARSEMAVHPVFAEALPDRPELARLLERQRAQLADFFTTMRVQEDLYDQQITQIIAQIDGVEAELEAKIAERALMAKDIEKARTLAERQLVNLTDLHDLERRDVVMLGERGALEARVAELRGRVAELRLSRHAVGPEMRETAAAELARQRPLRARYLEQRAKLMDALDALEIRAPVAGTVHDSRLLGERSVVKAAEPLLMIVPDDAAIEVEVKIDATDIDQVFEGQDASLRFNAYSARDTPIILGRVIRVSADAFQDPVKRTFYYEVGIGLLPDEVGKLGDRSLTIGMPVDAFLATTTQTPMDYLLRPLETYVARAFRDR
jgi:HlyD family secretion protein